MNSGKLTRDGWCYTSIRWFAIPRDRIRTDDRSYHLVISCACLSLLLWQLHQDNEIRLLFLLQDCNPGTFPYALIRSRTLKLINTLNTCYCKIDALVIAKYLDSLIDLLTSQIFWIYNFQLVSFNSQLKLLRHSKLGFFYSVLFYLHALMN